MVWRISRADHDAILAAAAATPDVEVCGLLLGGGGTVERILPCANVAAQPARQFEINPAALIAAHKAARAGGAAVIGCYHSHPNGLAGPSAADADTALAGLWLIIADAAVTAWHWSVAGFEAAALEIEPLPAESRHAKASREKAVGARQR